MAIGVTVDNGETGDLSVYAGVFVLDANDTVDVGVGVLGDVG